MDIFLLRILNGNGGKWTHNELYNSLHKLIEASHKLITNKTREANFLVRLKEDYESIATINISQINQKIGDIKTTKKGQWKTFQLL